MQRGDVTFDPRDQRLGGGSQIGSGGIVRGIRHRDGLGGIFGIRLGSWRYPAMEIFGAGEILPDQLGADDFAIFFDQAAIGLMRKQQLAKSGHPQRIDQTGEDRKQHDHQDGGTDLFQHDAILRQGQWR